MIIASAKIKLYAPWVHSLKAKRSIVKSLLAKVRNQFNVSASEVDEQDTHQTIIMGFACVAVSVQLANTILDSVIRFIESNTEAEIIDIEREVN